MQKILALFVIALFILSALSLPSFGTSESTPISHVIYIMMENHSFDNIFGAYPTDHLNLSISDIRINFSVPLNLLSDQELYSKVTQVPPGSYNTSNPNESVYQEDFDGGKMDGFLQYSGSQSMTYFTDSQLAIEWDWAEEYGIGDNYFATVLSETTPNRLYSLAGFSPVSSDCYNCPPPFINSSQSIFSELSSAGVSWGYFGAPGDDHYYTYPLNFFQGLQSYSSNIGSWGQFEADLNRSFLPSVSFVSPLGYSAVDQHPPDNVTFGEEWLLGIVDSVMKSPYWSSSAIFINYDEGGGYVDQVPPPVLEGEQLGFRVPLIVISPYAKENYVSHTELNHDSILAFIEYNWGLPALNKFVDDSNIPLDFFDFSDSPRAPVILSNSSSFPIGLQTPFQELSYSRNGSSSITLAPSSLLTSTGTFSTSSEAGLQGLVSFLFNSETGQILLIVLVVVLISAIGFALRPRRGRRQRYYGNKP